MSTTPLSGLKADSVDVSVLERASSPILRSFALLFVSSKWAALPPDAGIAAFGHWTWTDLSSPPSLGGEAVLGRQVRVEAMEADHN